MTTHRAHLLLWLLALAPALVALWCLPPGAFATISSALNALGRLTGIAGLGLFLVAAISCVRMIGFDRWFGGLTSLWQSHHLLGAWSFLLLLAHPLLLALANVELSLNSAVTLLFPSHGGAAIWAGWGALVLMMIFLAPSFAFFGKPDYQKWKKIHGLSGIAAVLAIAHTLWLARTIAEPWDSIIWLTLIAAALASLAYSLIFARRASQFAYAVNAVHHPANNVVELSLAPEGRALSYAPGQFVYLSHFDRNLSAGYGEEHPYTLSSSPSEKDLRITIKDLGDASRAIQQITTGAKVRVCGPYGAFFPQHSKDRELWIAGGIGITPFLGRARHLAATGTGVDIQLIYCIQDEARALFADELQGLAQAIPGFTLSLHYYYQHGPLDADFLRYHCADMARRQIYICGPKPLITLARELSLTAGVPHKKLHSEEFDLL